MLAIVALVIAAIVALAFLLGQRRGKRARPVVEIRRV